MRFRRLLPFFLLLTGIRSQEAFSVPPVDSPELAARGRYGVGVRTIEIVHTGQVDILKFDKATGKAPLYDRPLTLEVWYPAVIPASSVERVVWEQAIPRGITGSFRTVGKALRDAAPVSGERFPLVVVSHGYPGSRIFMSYLSENLASKGYVVAAIDHTDSVFGKVAGFESTLLNRSADQLFTIEAMSGVEFLKGTLDDSRVAIVGYSMGGYGALATAGAGYSKQGGSARLVPGGYFDAWIAGDPRFEGLKRDRIKAMVAIAPWGNQPPNNNWDEAGLAGIKMPSLFIVGDQDDTSGYEQGVRKAYRGVVNSDRYLLVYANARHNTGGNPAPPEVMGNFAARAFFDEPVWRKDRIAAINQHFVTAFLDLWLKGDASRRAYLDDAKKGFQNRWAVGIEMVHTGAGK
jgi:predicted dienelactone hydrolase